MFFFFHPRLVLALPGSWEHTSGYVTRATYPDVSSNQGIYYEEIKRGLNRILIYDCRCDERLIRSKATCPMKKVNKKVYFSPLVFICNRESDSRGRNNVFLFFPPFLVLAHPLER